MSLLDWNRRWCFFHAPSIDIVPGRAGTGKSSVRRYVSAYTYVFVHPYNTHTQQYQISIHTCSYVIRTYIYMHDPQIWKKKRKTHTQSLTTISLKNVHESNKKTQSLAYLEESPNLCHSTNDSIPPRPHTLQATWGGETRRQWRIWVCGWRR